MPYIPEEKRERLLAMGEMLDVPGELNYLITEVVIDYCQQHGLSYNQAINAIVGALECCKLEFYRRVAAPYEDKAIERNGDVYPKELVGEEG